MTHWRDVPDAELDARLARELREHSNPTQRDDWVRIELLPAVRDGIHSRSSPDATKGSRVLGLAGVAVAAVVLLVVVGVLTQRLPTGPAAPATPPSVTVRSGDFTLTITADKATYLPDEPIDVEAVLTYDGPEEEVAVAGVGRLIPGFSVRQLDGPLVMDASWDVPCLRDAVRRGEPVRQPFQKSGGWSPGEPNADFYESWYRDPVFTLPEGQWEVTAIADFGIGDCGDGPVRIEASIVITVAQPVTVPAATPTPSPAPGMPSEPRPDATPTPAPTSRIECSAFNVDGTADVQVLDHSGLLTECFVDAGAAIDAPVRAYNPDGDLHTLRVEWEVPRICSSMPAAVEVAPPVDGASQWAIAVTKLPPVPDPQIGRVVCRTDSGPHHQAVILRLNDELPADAVEVVLSTHLALRTSEPNPTNACPAALATGQLWTHPETGLGIGSPPSVEPIVWPFGYSAQLGPDGAGLLIGPKGNVVARQGDLLSLGGGYGVDGIFHVCGPFAVLEAAPAP